jgi:hypothetical protein
MRSVFLRAMLARPIAFHPILARIGRGAAAGLFMSQALYWSERTNDTAGWFYKTGKEWHEETILSRREIENARERWKELGVLYEHLAGNPARLYYRIDLEALTGLIAVEVEQQEVAENAVQTSLSDVTNKNVTSDKQVSHIQQTSLSDVTNYYNTETTTDTTTETTSVAAATQAALPASLASKTDDSMDVVIPEPVPGAVALTGKVVSAIVAANAPGVDVTEQPDFALMGKKRVTARGSLPPDRIIATENGLRWARGIGWRSGLTELQMAVDANLDYYKGEGKPKGDWVAVTYSGVRRAIERGLDLKLSRVAPGQENANGQIQEWRPGAGAGPDPQGYGYDRSGQPANKATQLRTTAQRLAQRQRDRANGVDE